MNKPIPPRPPTTQTPWTVYDALDKVRQLGSPEPPPLWVRRPVPDKFKSMIERLRLPVPARDITQDHEHCDCDCDECREGRR